MGGEVGEGGVDGLVVRAFVSSEDASEEEDSLADAEDGSGTVGEEHELLAEAVDGSGREGEIVDSGFAASAFRPAKKECARRASGFDFGWTPRRSEGSRTYELSVGHFVTRQGEQQRRGRGAAQVLLFPPPKDYGE